MVVPLSSRLDTSQLRKARGAFFTPEPVARFVTDWALRSASNHVLEPSCGEAAFLLAAMDRLTGLPPPDAGALDGVELHHKSAAAATRLLAEAGVEARVTVGDFFTVTPTGSSTP